MKKNKGKERQLEPVQDHEDDNVVEEVARSSGDEGSSYEEEQVEATPTKARPTPGSLSSKSKVFAGLLESRTGKSAELYKQAKLEKEYTEAHSQYRPDKSGGDKAQPDKKVRFRPCSSGQH